MIEIINKPLLLHLVGYLYYWQMGFNSVFKGLIVYDPYSSVLLVPHPFAEYFLVSSSFNFLAHLCLLTLY